MSGDVQDLYVEHLNEERTAAEHDGAWEPLTVHREEIHVRGAAEPVVVDVHETRHGPIIETAAVGNMHTEHIPLGSAETYALRWTGFDCGIRPSLVLDAAHATSFEEFRRATWGVECPGQNFVYADVDGTIGYQCSGRFPLRDAGDGTTPVPGMERRVRVERMDPVRRAAVGGRSAARLPGHREQPDPRRRATRT